MKASDCDLRLSHVAAALAIGAVFLARQVLFGRRARPDAARPAAETSYAR